MAARANAVAATGSPALRDACPGVTAPINLSAATSRRVEKSGCLLLRMPMNATPNHPIVQHVDDGKRPCAAAASSSKQKASHVILAQRARESGNPNGVAEDSAPIADVRARGDIEVCEFSPQRRNSKACSVAARPSPQRSQRSPVLATKSTSCLK